MVGHLRAVLLGLAVLAVAAVSGACDLSIGGPTPGPTPAELGIRGVVLLGPTCPVVSRSSPCVRPYVARLAILDGDDQVVTEVTSGPDGRFEVTLPPGEYTIQPIPGGQPVPNARPIAVAVSEGEYTDVEIDYDTGIR